jgi:DDE superfamily endonuclease
VKHALLGTTAGTPVEIWFQDEARVGQKGTLSYVWGPVGSRPPMVRDNRHDTAYILGAICPARGIGAAIITPAANTECINLHLAEISTHVAAGAVAALIWDGAGWHQSGGELKVPDNIRLIPLPPYAPELNAMEMSGSIYVPTNCQAASGMTTTLSSPPAPTPGTGSSTIQTAFDPSAPETGHRSRSRAAGIS